MRSSRPPIVIAEAREAITDARNARKRRRLSDISNISRSTTQGFPVESENPSAERSREEGFQYATPDPDIVHKQGYESARMGVASSPLFFPDPPVEDVTAEKENEPPRNMAKKRKRKSIGQQSLFKKKKRTSGLSAMSTDAAPSTEHRQGYERPDNGQQISYQTDGGEAYTEPAAEEIPIPQAQTASPRIPKATMRRKKRKSITGVKKRRRSGDSVTRFSRPAASTGEASLDQEPANVNEHEHDPFTSLHQRRATGRDRSAQPSSPRSLESPRRMSRMNVRDDEDADEDADETYVPEEATPEPTPAPKHIKVKSIRREGPRSTHRDGNRISGRNRNKYPILTHRMANIGVLPTISEGVALQLPNGDEDDDVDELAVHAPGISTKSTPNAVDVLAQACRETIDASVEGLQQLTTAERTRQTAALQSFRAVLDIRLFELSQSLDHRLHMEARLRKQRREKAELQARWLEVRKQRDVMALRMDAARRQHWENEEMSRQAWDVSQSAHRLETAVSRAEPEQESQAALLESSLREVGQEVSSKNGGGVLNVLRTFNAQLEQVVRASN